MTEEERIFDVMNTPYSNKDMEGVRRVALKHIENIKKYFNIYLYDNVVLKNGKEGVVKQIVGKDVFGCRKLGILIDTDIIHVHREEVEYVKGNSNKLQTNT